MTSFKKKFSEIFTSFKQIFQKFFSNQLVSSYENNFNSNVSDDNIYFTNSPSQNLYTLEVSFNFLGIPIL